METEGSRQPAGRPRPWLLVALALVAGLWLVSWMMSGNSAVPGARPSNVRTQAANRAARPVDPADLEVRLDALTAPAPGTPAADRNPFRFYVRPPAAPAPEPTKERQLPTVELLPEPSGPPAPPKIPLKFIGVLEVTGIGKVAAFSDCRVTMRGREGEVIAGQYRLVSIGVESVVMEYVDGRGRETIRMSGQDCVGK
jgi:hypothetical protein